MSEEIKQYPKWLYHPEHEAIEVADEEEEAAYKEEGYVDNPSEYGVYTAPSADQLREMQKSAAKKKR